MTFPNFINKSIISNMPIRHSTTFTKITDRISPELYSQFSNLNFAGIYKIGSASNRRDCYIGAAYNVTLKITHHLNLLYRKEHHSKELQDWVNENGIENIDITLLRRTISHPEILSNWEQFYLTLIKPKFNTILNKKEIKVEHGEVVNKLIYFNTKHLNEFGNPIISKFNINTPHKTTKFIVIEQQVETERKLWKPTIIINTEDEFIVKRGDITNIKEKKKVEVVETKVYRNVFKAKGT